MDHDDRWRGWFLLERFEMNSLRGMAELDLSGRRLVPALVGERERVGVRDMVGGDVGFLRRQAAGEGGGQAVGMRQAARRLVMVVRVMEDLRTQLDDA